MANRVNFLSLVSILGVVTGCGSVFDFDAANNANEIVEESDSVLGADLEADEAALALSISVARKSKKGVIVAEKAINLPLALQMVPAIYPAPKEKTCLVHAGSHLINLKQEGENQFSAEVSYHGLKIALNRISCKQGEIVSVRAGSGFQGLAVVSSMKPTYFKKELVSIPKPQPLDPINTSPEANPKRGAGEGSESEADSVTILAAGSNAEYTSPALCDIPVVAGPVDCPRPPEPPVFRPTCAVFSGRQNIKIKASKGSSYISGTTVAANSVIALIWYSDECENGESLRLDSKNLSKALSSKPVAMPTTGVK